MDSSCNVVLAEGINAAIPSTSSVRASTVQRCFQGAAAVESTKPDHGETTLLGIAMVGLPENECRAGRISNHGDNSTTSGEGRAGTFDDDDS
jgi:hypothetical protein